MVERLREEGAGSPETFLLATRGSCAPQSAQALVAQRRHAEALPVFDLALRRARKLLAEAAAPFAPAQAQERVATLLAQAHSTCQIAQQRVALRAAGPASPDVRPAGTSEA